MVCGSDVWRSHPPGRSSGGNRICSFRERLIARLRAACVEEWLWKLKEPDDQVILPTTVLISMFYFVVVQAQSPMQALADVFNTRVTLSLKARIEDWKYRGKKYL